MHLRWNFATAALAGMLVAGGLASEESPKPESAQEAVFEQHCAVCHNNPATRAPARTSLHAMSPSFIVGALTSGVMQAQGAALSPAQRVALAEYLTGHKLDTRSTLAGRCTRSAPFSLNAASYNGWGGNPENWRFQANPGISATQLSRLVVKWAFGVPGAVAMFGQPTIAGGRVFFGTQSAHVYALDAQSGCYYWDYAPTTGVRTAITVARIRNRDVAFFGDRAANAYAVDAVTGQTIWRVRPDDSPKVQITGAPALFEGRLFIPISVGDDSTAIDPRYECCKGSGAIVALDAASGKTIWKTYTLAPARPQGKNPIGTQLWGPSGASIWSSPTIDRSRRMLYAGTGDNHSAPATAHSDAAFALAIDSGRLVWSRQLLQGDMGNTACLSIDKSNCPHPHGPDFDLGASPNLVTLPNGKRLLLFGQKAGLVWAIDPDDRGRIVWERRVGKGGILGGVQWGTATDGATVYAAVSDVAFKQLLVGQPLVTDPAKGGGLHALAVATGATRWNAPPPRACGGKSNCSPAQSAAVTATPDYVLSGSVDGHLRAYATADGKVLWDFNTARKFVTVDGVQASGGSIDSAGPTIAGGMLFVGSGYGLYGGQAGNVLIALAPRM